MARRRGLGSGPIEHNARAKRAMASVVKMSTQAIKYARAGRCTDALDALVAGARAHGQLLAEREAGAGVGFETGEVGILHVKRELRACFRSGGR